ncbi:MAG: NADH-quinone oxidoreductase subunit H [Lentisphaeria bacterium]|nr:NADH-quinone oxidoreductase subunit H [Lentisphaeria bacterium]
MIFWFVSFVAALVLAPLLSGIINKVKAFFAGRKGPSLFQLYYDIVKLLKKDAVYSQTAGVLLKSAPCISLMATFTAALFLPFGMKISPAAFGGDIIFFFYLLGTARFVTVLGALDTGSSFEGMGASREVQFSALAEAAIFGCLGFLVLLTREFSLSGVLTGAELAVENGHLTSVLLTAFALFIVLLAENCRVPFDDPETHLELTMIHEAMILDYGGPDLAMIFYGAALKLYLFASLLVMLVFPATAGMSFCGVLTTIAGVFVVAVMIGIVESCMARFRFLKVPQMLMGALAASLLAVVCLLVFEKGVC